MVLWETLKGYRRYPADHERQYQFIKRLTENWEQGGKLSMTSKFEIVEMLSIIDNFIENRELHKKDPALALRLVDQLKKMEVWLICKIYFDKSGFLHKIVDLCQNGPQNYIRKFMAFARYSFRDLGSERFEDCINRSSLTSWGKAAIIGCFRSGEIDHALVRDLSDAIQTVHEGISTNHFLPQKPANEAKTGFNGMSDESIVDAL